MGTNSANRIQKGLRLHQAGNLEAAVSEYQAVLSLDPEYADGWHLLGLANLALGRVEEAVHAVRKSLAKNQDVPSYQNSLGECLRVAKSYQDSERAFKRSIALAPNDWKAHSNLGVLLMDQRKAADAIEPLERALKLAPNEPSICINLGKAYLENKNALESVKVLERAAKLAPRMFEAWVNLSCAYRVANQWEKSLEAAKRAAQLAPQSSDVICNLGQSYFKLGLIGEAQSTFANEIKRSPGCVKAYRGLAGVRMLMRREDDAIALLKEAMKFDPNDVESLVLLVESHFSKGAYTEALEYCERCLQLDPLNPGYWGLAGLVLRSSGQLRKGIACIDKSIDLDPTRSEIAKCMLYTLNLVPTLSPLEILERHKRWAARHADPLLAIGRDKLTLGGGERLRVGLVSADWKPHPVGQFSEPLLTGLDRTRIELFCYSSHAASSERTTELSQFPEHWIDCGYITDEQLAERIVADRIHILIDLSGHTSSSRLLAFARRPAPVQATYLGYPATTGMAAIDFRISDPLADPIGMTEPHNTEELVRLRKTAWCFHPWRNSPSAIRNPIQPGERSITFGSFNNFVKINRETAHVWAELLRRVPDSDLLLKNKGYADKGVCQLVLGWFAERGIDPRRIRIMQWEPDIGGHLAAYNRVDVALDTFPYHGTTTTCEALYMGVPVVSLSGYSHASRVGVSLLTNVGLVDLIAKDEDEYVRIAAGLAADRSGLANMRHSLRQRLESSPIMDAKAFVRDFEEVLFEMWNRSFKRGENSKLAGKNGGVVADGRSGVRQAVRGRARGYVADEGRGD